MSYPSNSRRTHVAAEISAGAAGYACGRIASLHAGIISIVDESGSAQLKLECPPAGAAPGDIVEVAFSAGAVQRLHVLARAIADPRNNPDLRRFNSELRATLRHRAALIAEIRSFFSGLNFLEVETPALAPSPGLEPHLRGFTTRYEPENASPAIPLFLPSSPEYHMKRMLASGFEKIFQLCRSFRNGESFHLHNPEFTMLEWYRAYAGCDAIMCDLEALGARLAEIVNIQQLGSGQCCERGPQTVIRGDRAIDFSPPWERLTVREAFKRFAGIELPPVDAAAEFRSAAAGAGVAGICNTDAWDDVFYRVFLAKVEPKLGWQRPTFLTEYPASMAALAKVNESDPTLAERFELYIGGVEIANGFTELNDPVEQRQRFEDEIEIRRRIGAPEHPIDDRLLSALAAGMPPAGGVAVGVDRLIMILLGKQRIEDVIAFPFSHDFPQTNSE